MQEMSSSGEVASEEKGDASTVLRKTSIGTLVRMNSAVRELSNDSERYRNDSLEARKATKDALRRVEDLELA